MTVYVDDVRIPATVISVTREITAKWSHLTADTDEELHAFAARLGLKRSWAQYEGTAMSHYDVTSSVREKAIRLGALPITFRESARQLECKSQGLEFIPDDGVIEPLC